MSVYVIKSLAKKHQLTKTARQTFGFLENICLRFLANVPIFLSAVRRFVCIPWSESVRIPVGTKTFVRVAASAGRRSAVKASVGEWKHLAPPAGGTQTRPTAELRWKHAKWDQTRSSDDAATRWCFLVEMKGDQKRLKCNYQSTGRDVLMTSHWGSSAWKKQKKKKRPSNGSLWAVKGSVHPFKRKDSYVRTYRVNILVLDGSFWGSLTSLQNNKTKCHHEINTLNKTRERHYIR